MGKNADKFTKTGTEVIAVFREEKEGEAGLKKIVAQTNTPFTLAMDLNKEKTGRYSSSRGEFSGYVMNAKGTITKVFKGDLRNRAKSQELLTAIEAASEGSGTKQEGSGTKKEGSGAKEMGSVKKEAGSGTKQAGSGAKKGSGSK